MTVSSTNYQLSLGSSCFHFEKGYLLVCFALTEHGHCLPAAEEEPFRTNSAAELDVSFNWDAADPPGLCVDNLQTFFLAWPT